jgi:hypothetical protein
MDSKNRKSYQPEATFAACLVPARKWIADRVAIDETGTPEPSAPKHCVAFRTIAQTELPCEPSFLKQMPPALPQDSKEQSALVVARTLFQAMLTAGSKYRQSAPLSRSI